MARDVKMRLTLIGITGKNLGANMKKKRTTGPKNEATEKKTLPNQTAAPYGRSYPAGHKHALRGKGKLCRSPWARGLLGPPVQRPQRKAVPGLVGAKLLRLDYVLSCGPRTPGVPGLHHIQVGPAVPLMPLTAATSNRASAASSNENAGKVQPRTAILLYEEFSSRVLLLQYVCVCDWYNK